MQILGAVLIIYGLFCILIGVLKLPAIWNMKKLRIMAKMFKGDRNLQIFVIVWGLIVAVVGILIR
jgi:hypothetical protein